ncbi:DUF6414 family protein [Promicromonospora iranensis]|uniref:Uncharacterized protein n=1 Tax=Promicromonospora iranensis TaxID=1105144 RepID=A0ABU2CK58_9MICO|nr:DUF6414 family protein [Promicromonospora iranensis]MDR7381725.1 hypothetical protein [Promicromonospora iranensis]
MIKIVYFDEESASDYLDISAGGKEESTSEKIRERSKETHAKVEASVIAKLSWLPFLGASGDANAGAGVSATGSSILSKTLSNTILTDYISMAAEDTRIVQLRELRVTAPKDSMAYMKMFTPYMVAAKMEDDVVDLARLDDALAGAKGYYELLGENSDGLKRVLRFNIKAFRNNYGLADLGRMQLVFHGIRVGNTTSQSFSIDAELSGDSDDESITAVDIVNDTASNEAEPLDVYDVILAGVEHAE